jgi:hypothetical protein
VLNLIQAYLTSVSDDHFLLFEHERFRLNSMINDSNCQNEKLAVLSRHW